MGTEIKVVTAEQDRAAYHSPRRQEALTALEKLRTLRRRGVRTYLGLWGLAYDRLVGGLVDAAQQGLYLSQQAEERGKTIEATLCAQLTAAEKQAVTGLVWLRARLDEQLQANTTPAATETEPPDATPLSPTAVAPMAVRSATLVDSTVAQRSLPSVPLKNYDKLMAKQIIDQLERLTVVELEAVQAYEQQRGARITVLRAIDQTLRRKLAVV